MRLIKPDNYQPEELYLSKIAHAISHPLRTRILELLVFGKANSRVELLSHFNISKAAFYQHMQILKDSNLINCNYMIHFEEIELNNSALHDMKQFLDKILDEA